MTQLVSGAQFIATTKVTMTWGRELSDAEKATLNSARTGYITGGTLVTPALSLDDGSSVSYWSNQADAEAYVVVCNSLTPAPTSISAEAI